MPHESSRSPLFPHRLLLAACVAAAALQGCTTLQPAKPLQHDSALGTAPLVGVEPVQGGIFSSVGSYTPLTGDALHRALKERPAITTLVENAVTTAPASTEPATQAADADPPPLAVKYYLQGREKFLEGANTEAMEFLDKALQLDPNAFTVLRLMGRVCYASSQLGRGSLYLQRAQRLRPEDVEVNYLLGGYWLERKDFDRAVYYLLRADDSPERSLSSAQTPLVSFYLAKTLQADGFNKAAAAEYEKFLETISLPVPGYRYDRELNALIEESWATHLAAAENYVAVGDYGSAIPHYEAALADESGDTFVASRLINAQVHTQQMQEARTGALTLVEKTKGMDDAINLLIWVYRAAHAEAAIIPDLRTAMSTQDQNDAAPAITLAVTQDFLGHKQDAFTTLNGYLQKHPANVDVLSRLLKRVDSAQTFDTGLRATARAIDAAPDQQSDLLKLFLPLTEQAPAKAFLDTPGLLAQSGSAAGLDAYLLGLTLRAQNGDPAAIAADLRKAVQDKPAFFPAREAYVAYLLSQEQFAQASDIVSQAITRNEGGAKAWELLIDSECAQHRFTHALSIAQDAVKKFPASPDLQLKLAAVYDDRGQQDERDTILAKLTQDHPKFAPGHEAYINGLLNETRDSGGGNPEQTMTRVVAAVSHMVRELPDSKFAQITTATLYARGGRLEDAEATLVRLLPASAADPEVLVPLAQIRQLMNRPAEAINTLLEPLNAKPQPLLAQAAVDLYIEQEKPADALALAKRLMAENPSVEAYYLLDASTLADQKKYDEAIALLTAAQPKFPRSQTLAYLLAGTQERDNKTADAVKTMRSFIDHNGETAERLYELSHFYSAAEQDDQAVITLQRVLALMPDHTGASNDLGYFWADAGTHLPEAETLIQKAVDNEPQNAAYLDSLGWLNYKQGRFTDAVRLLGQAVSLPRGQEADVMQHLGDALYRAGDKTEALERWLQSQALATAEDLPPTRDNLRLKNYLDKVIAAARAGETPQLTPTAILPSGQRAESQETPATAPAAR